MIDRNLLLKASDASIGVTAAQTAVEDAKRAVEEARAAVEHARQGVADAKAAYDAAIADITATGVPAAKARRAVEELTRIFTEFSDEVAPAPKPASEPRAPRKRKADSAPDAEVQAQVAEAPDNAGPTQASAVNADPLLAAEDAVETVVDTIVEIVSEAMEEVAAAGSDVAADTGPVDAAPSGEARVNNEEAVSEIYALIEGETSNEDIFVSETLITVLSAADVYSVINGVPLDVDAYRTTLNEEFVEAALAMGAEMEAIEGELRSILATPQKIKVLAWFDGVLEALQNGKPHASFAAFLEPSAGAADAPEEPEEAMHDEISHADFTADPDADNSEFEDETLSLAGVEAEEVENIEEINFLEPDAVASAPAPEPAPAAAPAGTRRPAFLRRQ